MKLWIILVSVIGGLVTHSRYASALCGVSLPQHQQPWCRGFRDAGLNTQKLFWRLKHDENLHGFALLDVAPLLLEAHVLTDLFVQDYALNYLGMVVGSTATLGFYTVANFGKEINNISEYRTLSDFFKSTLTGQYMDTPSEHETVLSDKTQWISDKLFAQQRLAGSNPMSIKRVTINGDVGLDWNKLKETLNPSFDWNAAVQAALQNGDSLEDAIGQGRIYALRYELCDDMPRAEDQTDSDPRRAMWDFLSPIALFASVKVGQRNELVPVAIQMNYKPSSAVYTPADGDNWMMAKLNVQVTDIGYAQLVEHLDKIHYFLEPFCVCLKRNLAIQHPLHQMLKFHCRELVIPNTLGTPALTTEIGFVAKLFAYGAEGANRLVRDGHKFSTWEETDFRSKIKKRGLDDKNLIPYFPYRDDGEKILKVIEDMVKDYVDLYYEFDGHVKADWELKAYINELSSSGTGHNGGIGRVQGLPASINAKKELCDFLSRFICHVTIQHAAINYELTDFNYIPNMPTKLYDDTRVKEGEFSVYRLPNRVTAATQASFSNALSTFRYDTLFDYGQSAHLWDHKAKEVANRYHRRLLDVVQPDLEKENAKRLSNGDLTYPYFLPEWLPNGIQT